MHPNVVLIGTAGLGSGSEQLGGLILANFLRILGERDELPAYLILWNDGVRTALPDGIWIEHLKRLEGRGVRIIACRTCIEYFGLEGQTAVGETGTMSQIQEILLTNKVLTV
ncbi:MAG: hypothetical protein HYX78_15500 [Armatimonadetes bacterium]|nr:hypothetical protein [Armatimonadota bacterium]